MNANASSMYAGNQSPTLNNDRSQSLGARVSVCLLSSVMIRNTNSDQLNYQVQVFSGNFSTMNCGSSSRRMTNVFVRDLLFFDFPKLHTRHMGRINNKCLCVFGSYLDAIQIGCRIVIRKPYTKSKQVVDSLWL